jgi:hypothetical protein
MRLAPQARSGDSPKRNSAARARRAFQKRDSALSCLCRIECAADFITPFQLAVIAVLLG